MNRSLTVACSLVLCGAFALSIAPSASAAPKKNVGVRAWTSGSTTTIRARPSVNTPVVAKVSRHMPLFVWGKYNGWYRVETHDHMFGWVHHPYINSPDIRKVQTMSAWKANDASKRTDGQIVFGTVSELKKFYIQTGADGARKGLATKGVYIDSPRDIMPTRSASAPKHVRKPVAVAAAKPPVVISVASPRPADPIPVAEPAIAASGEQTSRLLTLRQNALSGVSSNSVPQKVTIPVPPKVVAVPAVAKAAPKLVARIAAAPAPKAQPASRKMTWREKQWIAKANAKKNQREALRNRVGLAPKPIAPAAVASLPTISPEQLMEARAAYMQARQQRQAAMITPATNSPSVPNAQLGGQIEPAAPARITPSSYEALGESSHNLLLIEESGDNLVLKQTVGSNPVLVTTVVSNAQLKPAAKAPVINRGGSPRDRARMNLGNGIANQALGYRGMRYVYGSANPRRGFDCSGLIYFMLRQRGYNPPRTAAGYRNYGAPVARGKWQKGDLILFANTYKRGISHIGVYLGNNNFVHAATSGSGVRVDSLNSGYYAKKYHSARRVQ